MELAVRVISIPIILEGLPRSVVSHSAFIFAFIFSIRASNVTNSNKSSTQIVTGTKQRLRQLMPVEAFDQVRVENECNDYELGHSAGVCVHQDIHDEDEYVQY